MRRFIMITALLFAGALQAAAGLTGNTLGNRLTGTTVSISEVTAAGGKKLLFTETTSTGSTTADCAFDAHIDALEDAKLYLYEAVGGEDYDLDGNGLADSVPVNHMGTLHLLAYGSDIKAAGQVNMTFVSDEMYTKFRCELAKLPYEISGSEMNATVGRILQKDLTDDGRVDMKDVLFFDPVANQDALNALYRSKQTWIVSAIHNDDRFYFDGGILEPYGSYSFGAEPTRLLPLDEERLLASNYGLTLLDIRDESSMSAYDQTGAYADPTFDMARVRVAEGEDKIYFAAGAAGLQIYSIDSLDKLTLITDNVNEMNTTYGVAVNGDDTHLYAATSDELCHFVVSGYALTQVGGCIAIDASFEHRIALSPSGNYIFVYSGRYDVPDNLALYAVDENGTVGADKLISYDSVTDFVLSEAGQFLYLTKDANGTGALNIYELTDAAGGYSRFKSSMTFDNTDGIAADGDTLYLHASLENNFYGYYGASYIWQIDVTAPDAPFLKGQTLSGASKLALGTTRLFGVNGDALRMYDISDPESASAAGFVVGAGDVGYDRNATVAFVIREGGNAFSRIALDPEDAFMDESAVTATENGGSYVWYDFPSVSSDGRKLYIKIGGELSYFGIYDAATLDYKDAFRISNFVSYDVSGDDTTAAVLRGDQAILLNVSDESNISQKGIVDFNGTYPTDIALSADAGYLFMLKNYSDTNSSVWVYDISDANNAVRIGEVSGMPGYAEKAVRSHEGTLLAVLVNNYYSADGIESNVMLVNIADATAAAIVGTLPAYDADGYVNDVSFTSDDALIVRESCWSCTGSPVVPFTVYDLSDPADALVLKRIGTPHLEDGLSRIALTPGMDRMFAINNGNFVSRRLCDAPLPTVQETAVTLNLIDVNLTADNIVAVTILDERGTEIERLEDFVDGNSSSNLYHVEAGDTLYVMVERNEGGTVTQWYYNFVDGVFYDSMDGSTDFFTTADAEGIDVVSGEFRSRAAANRPPQLHIGKGGYGPMGVYPVDDGVRAMAQRDTILYLGDRDGVLALDVADPVAPQLLATSETTGNGVTDLLLSNDTLFASQESGLFIYDVSYPDALPLVGSYFGSDYDLISLAYDTTTKTLCVLEYQAPGTAQHVYLLDVNDTAAPRLRATIELNASAPYGRLSLFGHALYVTSDEVNATAYDISDPDAPTTLAGLMPPLKQLTVSKDGKRYYGVYREASAYREFFVILDRTFLLPLGVFPREDFFGIGVINDFSVDETSGLVYLATGDGAAVIDIADPAAIKINDRIEVASESGNAGSILVSGGNILVATDEGVNLFDDSRPQLFRVRQTYGLDDNLSGVWLWEQLQRHGDHLYFGGVDRLLQLNETDLSPVKTLQILPYGVVAEITAFDVSEDEQSVFAVIDEGNGTSTLRRVQNGTQTGSLAFDGTAMEIHSAVNGGIHYVSVEPNDGNWSIKIVDTNASTMRFLSEYTSGETFIDMATEPTGTLLYLAGDVVKILDVSNPYAPVAVGALELIVPLTESATPAISLQLDASGTTLYAGTFFGIAVIDVSDPSSPALVGWKSASVSQAEFFEYAIVTRSDDPSRLFTAGMEGPNVFDGTSFHRTGHFNELMRLIPSVSNDAITFDSIPIFQESDYARELRQIDATPRLYLKSGFGSYALPVQLFDTVMAVGNIHLDLNASGIINIGTISYDGMGATEWNLTVPLEEGVGSGIVRLTITVTDTEGASGTMPLDIVVYEAALPQPPGVPQHLRAEATEPEKVLLSWERAEGTVAGYRIYRDGSELAGVGPEDLLYEDATAQEGMTYRYGVLAFNDAGEGNLTETNVTTPHRMTVVVGNVSLDDFNITEVAVVNGQGEVIDTVSVRDGNNSYTDAVQSGEVFSLRFDVETSAGTVSYWYNFTDGRFYAQKGADADFERTTSTALTLITINAEADNWPSDAVHFVTAAADQSTTDVSADFNVSVKIAQSNHRTLLLTAQANYPTMLGLTPHWSASGIEADVYEQTALQLQLSPKTTGTARVTLRLSDTEGNSAVQTFNVAIVPAVTVTASQAKGKAPLVVEFTATVVPAFGDVMGVMWDFNDSADATAALELNATHTFTVPGDYAVKVTVLNPELRSATASRSLLVLDDNASWQIKAGWNYLSLPTSMHLAEEGLQSLFAPEAVRYLIKQSGTGWAYWDRNLTADPQMQMNRFGALDSAEGFALYADEDLTIELPVNQNNDPDAFRRLYGAGWYLVGVNRNMTVEEVQALVEAQGKELELLEYIDPEGTMHVYTPDTALDAQISQRFPRLKSVERTWGFYVQIEEGTR